MSNRKQPTISEIDVNTINTNVFFKEFTFGFENFIKNSENTEIELADNIVWLDDVAVIYEVKERNQEERKVSFDNWFKNKILNKAVKQIKNTIKVLESQSGITIKNNRGLEIELSSIPLENLGKVIIYNPNEIIPEETRFLKFYCSKEAGLIHLFHLEDYLWVCRYLITPYEVNDYLVFREQFYDIQSSNLDALPEQYILGHYFSDTDFDVMIPDFVELLKKAKADNDSFYLSQYLSDFGDKVEYTKGKNDYYFILREIAKLHRNELKEFKKRFVRLFDLCKKDSFTDPYRIAISTGCGFVFLALPKTLSVHWENSLTNITLAHQYEQKLNKCIGVVVFEEAKRFQVFWLYSEGEWEYDEDMEIAIKKLPLRNVKAKPFKGYHL